MLQDECCGLAGDLLADQREVAGEALTLGVVAEQFFEVGNLLTKLFSPVFHLRAYRAVSGSVQIETDPPWTMAVRRASSGSCRRARMPAVTLLISS
ncbi:hypothetical protein [Streptomyces sp. NPDC054834]